MNGLLTLKIAGEDPLALMSCPKCWADLVVEWVDNRPLPGVHRCKCPACRHEAVLTVSFKPVYDMEVPS